MSGEVKLGNWGEKGPRVSKVGLADLHSDKIQDTIRVA